MSEVPLNATILKFLRNAGRAVKVKEVLGYVRSDGTLRADSAFAADLEENLPPNFALSRGPANDALGLELLVGPFMRRLQKLHSMGLISLQPTGLAFLPRQDDLDRRVQISPNFIEIQRALGFSLTDAATRKANTISITPVFDAPQRHDIDVFVIMPFAAAFDGVYKAIADCCRDLNLTAKRGDDLFKPTHVIHDIWSLTASAKLIICDCTNKNPNVFYELGIAHTLGKQVVLIAQSGHDIPFDLRQWRHLIYEPQGEQLKGGLRAYLEAAALK